MAEYNKVVIDGLRSRLVKLREGGTRTVFAVKILERRLDLMLNTKSGLGWGEIKFGEKHRAFLGKLWDKQTRLLVARGAGRSGKTYMILYGLLKMFLEKKMRGAMVKQTLKGAKTTIMQDCIEILTRVGAIHRVHVNSNEGIITFSNGSVILFMEAQGVNGEGMSGKVLGDKFNVVYINEAQQIAERFKDVIVSRLSERVEGYENKLVLDYNPPKGQSWVLDLDKKFRPRDAKFTDTVELERIYFSHFGVEDNIHNINEGYLLNEMFMSEEGIRMFIKGVEAVDNTTYLWEEDWIKRVRYDMEKPEYLDKVEGIYLGFDPAMSHKGDECGIVEVVDMGDYYVVNNDFSGNYTDSEFYDIFVRRNNYWEGLGKSMVIIVETNNHGDVLVNSIKRTCRDMGGDVSVVQVRAVKGKGIRAYPVSVAYREGQVFHNTFYSELERLEREIMGMTNVGYNLKGESPNRCDALCWAMSGFLRVNGLEHKKIDVLGEYLHD